MKNSRISQTSARKGVIDLTCIWMVYLFSFSVLVSAFFVGQRIKAIRKMQKTEAEINRLHLQNFKGKRSWWPEIAQPQKLKSGIKVTKIKKPKNQKVSIDFGGLD